MIGHTPGPWILDERNGCVAVHRASAQPNCLAGAAGTAIHYNGGYKELAPDGTFERWVVPPEALANARLIAAAPEMLEALEELEGIIEWMSGSNDFGPEGCARDGWIRARYKCTAAHALIRRAKGLAE